MDDIPLSAYRRAEGWLGRTLAYYPRVGSTNDVAMAAGDKGAPEGLVVVADAQTAGRGRLQRRWHAPPGTGLLFSMLFRPPAPFSYYAPRTTMVCGLALLEALRDVAQVTARLKWPNDVILEPGGADPAGWQKLAGMLSEVGVMPGADAPAYLVVGIGLNVNLPADAVARLAPRATSLLAATGRPVRRVALLDHVLSGVERRYAALRAGDDPLPAWQAALAWRGRAVEVRGPTGVTTGVVLGVDAAGALRLRLATGEVRHISVGDVSLRPA